MWLAERLPAMSRVNLNPAIEGNSSFCCRKTSRVAFFAVKIDRIQKGRCLRNIYACHYTEPTADVVSGSPVYLTWRLKFLKYDWLMSDSTFQRCVLSRCENEQTQRVEHLIKDLHSCGITIKPWPVSQLERNFDLSTERYVFFVKGARIHVTVRQFDKCAFH